MLSRIRATLTPSKNEKNNLFTPKHDHKTSNTDNKSPFLLRSRSTIPGNSGRRVYFNYLNDTDTRFINNKVVTSRYTIANFLPKNLFLQFKRVANLFFLFMAIIQLFYMTETSDKVLSCLPLCFVLLVSAVKDGIEDYKRHKVDKLFNTSSTTVLRNWKNVNLKQDNNKHRKSKLFGTSSSKVASEATLNLDNADPKFDEACWESLEVGDFILIKNGEQVPADVLIISTNKEDGECYVETKSLDGETNLKTRYAIHETLHIKNGIELEQVKGFVEADAPSSNMFTLNGSISLMPKDLYKSFGPTTINTKTTGENYNMESIPSQIIPFSIKNVLLRGYVLKNTEYAIGLVIYTGKDTRIVLNSGRNRSKKSKIEKNLNKQVITNFVGLTVFSIILSVLYSKVASLYYGTPIALLFGIEHDSYIAGIEQFFLALILLQNVVPVSLYVSIEVVKLFQAYTIAVDIEMYDKENNYQCIPRSWNLSDDLGQIEYIFSDKTGTLTRNIMEFKKCIIGLKTYGKSVIDSEIDINKSFLSRKNKTIEKESHNSRQKEIDDVFVDKHFESMKSLFKPKETQVDRSNSFIDHELFDDIKKGDSHSTAITDFLTHLALCHSVLVDNSGQEETKDSKLETQEGLIYRAESPDEKTLVTAAKDLGFTYLGRSKNTIKVDIMGKEKSFELLDTLEFNSTRKRMSVIIRRPEPWNDLVLLCKGADNIIMERLSPNQEKVISYVNSEIKKFSTIGLRTLCLSMKKIDEDYYREWHTKYNKAQASANNRENEIDNLCEEIENKMILVGSTAIEDKLQDQVPETIKALRTAGIKVWVLTGDKMETAINIGMSCNLITEELRVWTVGAGIKKEVRDNFNHIVEELTSHEIPDQQDSRGSNEHAIVIEGIAFKHIVEDSAMRTTFLRVCEKFSSVICCRVSPLQKAQAVHLIKKGKNSMCLAIGDGANDVSMIQQAQIGVAIAGQEGLQASMASDYSISQFKHLRNLVLVHGQWSYQRLSEMIMCFFYKNTFYPIASLWYQFYCGFSSNLYYTYVISQLFNVVFTVSGVIFIGWFDRILNYPQLYNNPNLYKSSKKGNLFKYTRYLTYAGDAIWQSLVCFFVFYFIHLTSVTNDSGIASTGIEMSTGTAVSVILLVNIVVGFQTTAWPYPVFLSVIISICVAFAFLPIYSAIGVNEAYKNIANNQFANDMTLWLALPLIIVTCVLPRYTIRSYLTMFHPSEYQIIREKRKLKK